MAVTRALTLNRDMVLLLTDRVMNADAGVPAAPVEVLPLLRRLGGLYLELVDPPLVVGTPPPTEADVYLTEAETWLLRGKVTSGDRTQNDALLGVHLLRRLYTNLLAFDADLDGVAVAEGSGETFDRQHRENLTLWKQLDTRDTKGENPDDFQPTGA